LGRAKTGGGQSNNEEKNPRSLDDCWARWTNRGDLDLSEGQESKTVLRVIVWEIPSVGGSLWKGDTEGKKEVGGTITGGHPYIGEKRIVNKEKTLEQQFRGDEEGGKSAGWGLGKNPYSVFLI